MRARNRHCSAASGVSAVGVPGVLQHHQLRQGGAEGEVQAHLRQVRHPQAALVPHGGGAQGQPGHLYLHGAVAERAPRHRGGAGAEAGGRGRREGHQGVGRQEVRDHARRVRHHQRRQHARRRPRAREAPGPEAHHEARHALPDGLLRRRHRPASRQGPGREQQGREGSRRLQRSDGRDLPRPEREPPGRPRGVGPLRRWRRRVRGRIRPQTGSGEVPLRGPLGRGDHPARERWRHRRPPHRGGPHLPPHEGRPRADLQEYREVPDGGEEVCWLARVERHVLGRAPRRPRHSGSGGGEAEADAR